MIITAIAQRTPTASIKENGSYQKIAPERVGKMNPKEYTVEHSAVFPFARAAV